MKSYPLFKVHVPTEESLEEIRKVFNSGFINEGIQVTELEEKLKPYLGENLVLTNSCTSSIHLALHLCEIGPGDDVVTTPMTCVASNTPIATRGANLIWADIDPTTGMMTRETVAEALTEKTKAVVYVAWAGSLGDIERVQDLCRERGIPLILDAAHAFGAGILKEIFHPISKFVDYTCFSFQAIKHFTTGDGGALVTSRGDIKRAKNLKWFGLDRDSAKDEKGNWKGQQWDIDIPEAGYKFNMNNVSAAIGLSQVRHIDSVLEAHAKNSKIYDELFFGTHVRPLGVDDQKRTFRWVYTVRTNLKGQEKLDAIKKLNNEGIMAGLVHVPNDVYTCFSHIRKNLPGVREFEQSQFSIPCGWWLKEEDIKHIAERVLEVTR